jgi:hypothetical protein
MGGARLDLMRLCPEPATYELGFTHTERPVVVAIAEIRNDHVLRGDAAGSVEALGEQTIEGLLLFAWARHRSDLQQYYLIASLNSEPDIPKSYATGFVLVDHLKSVADRHAEGLHLGRMRGVENLTDFIIGSAFQYVETK